MNWKNKPTYIDDPEWYQERNKQLIQDKLNGMSIAELCGKYKITQKRIYTIVNNYKKGNKDV